MSKSITYVHSLTDLYKEKSCFTGGFVMNFARRNKLYRLRVWAFFTSKVDYLYHEYYDSIC